jgi:hypothetical protein
MTCISVVGFWPKKPYAATGRIGLVLRINTENRYKLICLTDVIPHSKMLKSRGDRSSALTNCTLLCSLHIIYTIKNNAKIITKSAHAMNTQTYVDFPFLIGFLPETIDIIPVAAEICLCMGSCYSASVRLTVRICCITHRKLPLKRLVHTIYQN